MGRVLLLIAAAVGVAGPAHATFGDKGQMMPAGGVGLNGSFPAPGDSGSTSYSVSVVPSLLYFIADRWALGGSAGIGYFKSGDFHQFSLSLGPTVAYALPISERASLFPELTVFGNRASITSTVIILPSGPVFIRDETIWTLSVSGFAPLLFHPVEHVSLGLGPTLTADLVATGGTARRIGVGLSSTIGVYF